MEMYKAKAKRKSLIAAVYRKANPNKMTPGFVKKVIQQYDGYEDVLAGRLEIKYGKVAGKEIQKLKEFIKEVHTSRVIKRRTSHSWAAEARATLRREEVQAKRTSSASGGRRVPPPKRPDQGSVKNETTSDTTKNTKIPPRPPERSLNEARKTRPLRASRPSVSISLSVPEGRHRGDTVGSRLEAEKEKYRSTTHVEDVPRRPSAILNRPISHSLSHPSTASLLREKEEPIEAFDVTSSAFARNEAPTSDVVRPRLVSELPREPRHSVSYPPSLPPSIRIREPRIDPFRTGTNTRARDAYAASGLDGRPRLVSDLSLAPIQSISYPSSAPSLRVADARVDAALSSTLRELDVNGSRPRLVSDLSPVATAVSRHDVGRPSSAPELLSRQQRLSVSGVPTKSTDATTRRPRLISAQNIDVRSYTSLSPDGNDAVGKSPSVAGMLRPKDSKYGLVTPSTSSDVLEINTRARQLSDVSLISSHDGDVSPPSAPSVLLSAAVEKRHLLRPDDPAPRHSLHRPRVVSALSDASAHSPPGNFLDPFHHDLPIVRAKESRHVANLGWTPSLHYGEYDAMRTVMNQRGEGKIVAASASSSSASSTDDDSTTLSHILDVVLRDVVSSSLKTSETKRSVDTERISETPPPTTLLCDDGEWRPITDSYFAAAPSSSSSFTPASTDVRAFTRRDGRDETGRQRDAISTRPVDAVRPSRRFTMLVDNPRNYRLVDVANRYCDSKPRDRVRPYRWRRGGASKTEHSDISVRKSTETTPRYGRLRAYLSKKPKGGALSAEKLALGATASSRAHSAYLRTEEMLFGGL